MSTTFKSGIIPADMIHTALTSKDTSATLSRMFGITTTPAEIVAGQCDTCGQGCYIIPNEPAVCVTCTETVMA